MVVAAVVVVADVVVVAAVVVDVVDAVDVDAAGKRKVEEICINGEYAFPCSDRSIVLMGMVAHFTGTLVSENQKKFPNSKMAARS